MTFHQFARRFTMVVLTILLLPLWMIMLATFCLLDWVYGFPQMVVWRDLHGTWVECWRRL